MVNTFLVDEDFSLSASRLDMRRLGKQRVEAYQLLILINQYRFLAKYFNIPDYPTSIDTPKDQRVSWVNLVITTFKNSGILALHVRKNLLIEHRSKESLPHKCKSGNQLLIDNSSGTVFEVKGKRQQIVTQGHWSNFVLPGEDLITTRIRKHPVVYMWLGFEEALKAYINAHINVWVERGYKNTMSTYEVNKNYALPNWVSSMDVINNFKSALIQKEIDRNEDAWYIKQDDFVDAWTLTAEHGRVLKEFVSRLPDDKWKNYVSKQQLLTLGNFPGYIWP